ncbi:MAG: hypothetical protein WCK18_14040 [Prolixibacteraceae bacterium]
MKFSILLFLIILTGTGLQAQNEGPVQLIEKRTTSYFSANHRQKIFIETDKTRYKPGETIWFRVFVLDGNNLPDTLASNDLLMKLFDASGKVAVQELFRLRNGSASCDLKIPEDLSAGTGFLCAFTSSSKTPQEVSYSLIGIYTGIDNQWLAETTLKDSLSTAGKGNEIRILLKDLSGKIQKNATLRYQLMNGTEILEGGKLKTDASGVLNIPFTLPGKSNGQPFIFELSENRGDWKKEIYLPSNLDSVFVRFYPEGGNLIPGTISKVGFTAFNKLGIPVNIEGTIQNQEGKTLTQVRTVISGLGLFSIDNAEGQRYKMVLTGSAHQNQSFELPPPDTGGMALSVIKSDAEFITTNLVFGDKLKHPVALLMTHGSSISWAADLEINAAGRIKIPVKEMPQGINLLSVFSREGSKLAERIVFVDKKQEFNITVHPEKISIPTGEKMKVKIRLSDENGKPIAGNISVSVADQFWMGKTSSITESLLLVSELETPVSLLPGALKGTIRNNALLDVFLISNHMKGFDWGKINSFKPGNEPIMSRDLDLISNKKIDEQLAICLIETSRKLALTDHDASPDPAYVSINEMLFQKPSKTYKANTIPLENQRKMLESSTSILEVIKTIKPYRLFNNMIVFYGSENSFNNQGGALIVIDGQQMGTDIGALSNVSPLEVDHINVSTNPMDIQKYTGLNSVGVIEINLKNSKAKEKEPVVNTPVGRDGKYRIAGLFPADPTNAKKDYRTTLRWIPEQKVDSSGEFEISVPAGKVVSEFIIEVQGLDQNGNPGRGEARFSVIPAK